MVTLVGCDRAVKGARQVKSWRQTYLLPVIALTALLSVIL